MIKYILCFMVLSVNIFSIQYNKGVKVMNQKMYTKDVEKLFSTINDTQTDEQIFNAFNSWRYTLHVYPSIEGDLVTFIYFDTGKSATSVSLTSPINNFATNDYLFQYKKTPVYFKSYRYKDIDSVPYYFTLNDGKNLTIKKDVYNKNITLDKLRSNVVRIPGSNKPAIQAVFKIRPDIISTKIVERDIYIYLPPSYFNDSDKKYPVLYMQDGQNIFDTPTANYGGWKIDTKATELINSNAIPELIIVGIENTSKRKEEYVGFSTLYKHNQTGKEEYITESKQFSDNYVDFIVHKVKPLIDTQYRTLSDRENTAIAGSSFGAGVSLYIGYSYPEIFSKIGALSYGNYNPNVGQWSDRPFWITEYLLDKVITKKQDLQIYLDCGKLDVDAIFHTQAIIMNEGLQKIGFTSNKDLLFILDEKRGHNEKAWAERMEQFLLFFYGKK